MALLVDYGFDTVRWRWRVEPEVREMFKRNRSMDTQNPGYSEGHRGEVYLNTPLGRVGAYRDGLGFFEGRASATLHFNPDDHNLLDPSRLISAEQAAREWSVEHGLPIPPDSKATLGRVDLASELLFSNPLEGTALLDTMSHLDVPWLKNSVIRGKEANVAVESVSFHSAKGNSIQLRAYDKGIESQSHDAGFRIRVERQKRFRKEREMPVAAFLASDLGRVYMGREFEKLSDLPSAIFSDLRGSLESIMERGYSWQQVERLSGFVVVGRFLESEIPLRTWQRRMAEFRELGIFIDEAYEKRLEVPMGRYLQTLAAPWRVAA